MESIFLPTSLLVTTVPGLFHCLYGVHIWWEIIMLVWIFLPMLLTFGCRKAHKAQSCVFICLLLFKCWKSCLIYIRRNNQEMVQSAPSFVHLSSLEDNGSNYFLRACWRLKRKRKRKRKKNKLSMVGRFSSNSILKLWYKSFLVF